MRRAFFFWCVLLLMGNPSVVLHAQQSSSSGDVFAGQDPLSVSTVVMPVASNAECIPPRSSNWKLLAKQNETCYFVAPLPRRINGYVTSINNVGAVEKAGGRCGVDEFNASMAVCQNAGDQFDGASPTKGLPAGIGTDGTPDDSTASTGNYRRQPLPPAYDPCHPNYNMSTASGRAAAQQNAARDQQACNDARCQHNPDLPFCGGPPNIAVQVPPGDTGGKGLRPFPIPPSSQGTPSGPLLKIVKQMNDCLQKKVPYWMPTDVQSQYMDMARQKASASVRSTPPQLLDAQTQVFVVETAMALQAQALHDRTFGAPQASSDYHYRHYNPADPHDSLNPAYAPSDVAGWLERCLANSGLQPDDDMRAAYAKFLGTSMKDGRIYAFGSGYNIGPVLAPGSLLPER